MINDIRNAGLRDQGQVVRAIGSRVAPMWAIEIPEEGFGEVKLVRKMPSGLMATETVKKAFRMSCGCLIAGMEQCGCPCPLCLEELRLGEIELPWALESLSSDQLDWLTTPCREHYFTCSWPFCDVMGGCFRHCAEATDGKHYCVDHFDERKVEIAVERVHESRGFVASKAYEFWRSLFFNL